MAKALNDTFERLIVVNGHFYQKTVNAHFGRRKLVVDEVDVFSVGFVDMEDQAGVAVPSLLPPGATLAPLVHVVKTDLIEKRFYQVLFTGHSSTVHATIWFGFAHLAGADNTEI